MCVNKVKALLNLQIVVNVNSLTINMLIKRRALV